MDRSRAAIPINRLQSVDVLRTVAIFFVIAIHTTPFELQSSPIGHMLDLATVINQIARFAVPFFFVLSGYFWANKFKDEKSLLQPTTRMAKKILILFVAWSAIYLLPTNIVDSFSYGLSGPVKKTYWNLESAVSSPLKVLMQGTKVHLWFLVGLLCSLSISAFFVRYRLNLLLVVVAIALYLVGLAGKAYSDSPFGFSTTFNFRNGPFFPLIFFVTGYFIQRSNLNYRRFPLGCFLALIGVLLHFAELKFIHRNWGTTMAQDFVIGTYFYGVGVFLIAVSNIERLNSFRIASVGPLVLGIYASQFIFVDMLKPFDRRFSGEGVWEVLYVVAVFLLSYALALIFSKHRVTRRLVA